MARPVRFARPVPALVPIVLLFATAAAFAQTPEVPAAPDAAAVAGREAPEALAAEPRAVAGSSPPEEMAEEARAVAGVPEPETPGTPLPSSASPVPDGVKWAPPVASPDADAWIRMSSGEWLRGSLDRIDDGTVYFDSEEFDDLEVDYADVVEIRAASPHTYRIENGGPSDDYIITGTAGLRDGILKIDDGSGPRVFDRKRLVGMISGGQRELDYWSGEVTLGFTSRSGNTDQQDLSTYILFKRETPLTRGTLSYRGAQSASNGDETANNHRISGQFDYRISKRFFLTAPGVELYRDPFQNTALRATTSVGLGYEILDTAKWDWEIGGGVGYQYTDFDTAPAGEAETSDDAAVSLSTDIGWEPTSRLELDLSYRIQLVATNFDQTNHNLTFVNSTDVWGPLDLDVTFIWDRIWRPTRDSTGIRPESDDFRIEIGLSLDW